MKKFLTLLALLALASAPAFGQVANTVVTFDSAKVTAGHALPGSNAIVTVSFKIQPGYYLHANRPSVARAVPTQMQLGTTPAARSLPAAYSAPGQKTIPNNPMPASVYEGAFTAQVPVVIAPNAQFPIALTGIVAYAPVNEKNHVAGRAEQVRFNVSIPRGTNAPPANTKAPADPKKK